MSAEVVQHRQGQLTSQPQTVCPPPLWEALQGPPFPDQQVQEQVHPCGCHPTELPPTHPSCPSPTAPLPPSAALHTPSPPPSLSIFSVTLPPSLLHTTSPTFSS